MPGTTQPIQNAIVAESGTLSNIINTSGYMIGAFQLPSSITGTQMTFKVSDRASAVVADMQNAKDDDGVDIPAMTIAANKCYQIPTSVMSHRWIAFSFADAQAAARTIPYSFESPA